MSSMTTSLVIGGHSGIGSIAVKQLRQRGDRVYTISRRKLENENHVCCDITKDYSKLKNISNKIDNVIFTHRYRGSDWDDEFDVTVKGVDNAINALLPSLSDSSSVIVEQPASYHSSRAALEGLMRYYSVVYGKYGVRFNCILPSSLIKPENSDFFIEDNKERKMKERITPLGRMGNSQDVANLIEFLCSNKSSFITGNSIFIDGGLFLIGQESIARDLLDLKHN